MKIRLFTICLTCSAAAAETPPVVAPPPMSFKDTTVGPGEKPRYAVRSVNAAGLASTPVAAIIGANP